MADTEPITEHVWTVLPGLHGTDALFGKLRSAIPARQECEWIDLPAKGKQDYQTLSDWLDGKLEHLENKKRLIIAESFSGPLAVMLASKRPDEVAGIVQASSFCHAPLNPGIALLPLRPLFMVKPHRKALEHFLIGKDASDEEIEELSQVIQSIPSATLTKRVRAILEFQEEDSPELKGIPMLLLQAQEDNLVPWEAQQRLEAHFPDARVHWLPSPHMMLQRHPIACLEKIMDFVSTTIS